MWRRKSSTSKTKSEAYLIYSEWGPDRQIPRDERLAARFPEADEGTRAAWMAEFVRVESEIWRFAREGGPRLHTFDIFKKRMLASFPFMNDPALSRAWTLASYYTAHEGY